MEYLRIPSLMDTSLTPLRSHGSKGKRSFFCSAKDYRLPFSKVYIVAGSALRRFIIIRSFEMIDHRTAPYAAFILRLTIAGYFAAALYGKFILKPISLWWATSSKRDTLIGF
jgi:hypothetical protein